MGTPDIHHLNAAQGWIELGNPVEANAELEKIQSNLRAHPDVLEVRYEINAFSKKLQECVDWAEALVKSAPRRSFGWIRRSFALHELKRTQEALDLLTPAVTKFKDEWVIPYNLACYSAQLGRLEECKSWFSKAMEIDEHAAKKEAVDDPDLRPFWDSLAGTHWKKEG